MSKAVAGAGKAGAGAVRRPRGPLVLLVLVVLLVIAAFGSMTVGAAGIPLPRLLATFGLGAGDPSLLARDGMVVWSIRLPRIVLAAMVGALLAAAGAVMQGLFRNPLADPGLVGVSSGAALAAAITIVAADRFLVGHVLGVPLEVLPFAAFAGALITTSVLYRIATRHARTSIAIFLLGGIAIAALANSAIGLLVFLSDDRQLRDITLWMLGSLGGATWSKAFTIMPFLAAALFAIPMISRGLDLLTLGEAEAFHAGISVERLKQTAILLIAAATGAAVAVSGVIGFVGIVIPHLLRLAVGPGHRLLLPSSLLLGASMMMVADSVARIIAAPAEVPIGIITAAIGAPFFLYLLLRQRSLVSL
jgi:iron complex transport system permease protein